jgi:hypothetical protein
MSPLMLSCCDCSIATDTIETGLPGVKKGSAITAAAGNQVMRRARVASEGTPKEADRNTGSLASGQDRPVSATRLGT